MKNSEYEINESILRLIQPYSEDSIDSLKKTLVEDPSLRVIHVWNGSHLDDIEAYKICQECNLKPFIEEIDFPDLNYAAVYVCQHQLERTDLSSEYKKYLIGQRYCYEHAIKASLKLNDSQCATAEAIAADLFISAGTVRKYSVYAMAMNNIFDQDTTFAKSILSGKLKISHENTIELARLRDEEIRAVAKSSIEEKVEHITLSYIRNEVKWSHVQTRQPVSRRERNEQKIKNKVTIRQMPEYDPDSEVNSLCLTIDSWISSMHRVKSSESFPKISYTASLKLMKKLTLLEHTITIIQDSLVERTNYET